MALREGTRRSPYVLAPRRAGAMFVMLAMLISCHAARSRPLPCVPGDILPRVGVWAISGAAVAEVNRGIAEAPFSYGCCGPFDPFFYDGETITMKFFREKEWMIGPPDDLYRLQAKWEGDHLYWLSTAKTWVFLATWRGDHYERASEPHLQVRGKDYPGVLWRFEHVDLVDPETADPLERLIAGPAGRWDYERQRALAPESERPRRPTPCVPF
jgi:hypothetical protein